MRAGLLLIAALAIVACGESGPPAPPLGGSAGSGGHGGGAGGAGGSGGGRDEGAGGTGGRDGGAGGSGGEVGGEPPDGSGWAGVEARLAWRHQSFGDAFELSVADFSGDGAAEIAVGARRPFLLEGDGSSIAWYVDWEPADLLTKGGDSEFTYGLAAIPSDAGGADLLVTSSLADAFLVDGRTGERIWHTALDVRFPFVHLAVFGARDDPLFFTTYGQKAHRARTGEVAWEVPVDEPTWARPIRLASDAPRGLLIGKEMGANVGEGGGFTGVPAIYAFDHEGELVFERGFSKDAQLDELFAADLDGSGVDSPLLAFGDDALVALRPDGTARWETTISLFDEPWHHVLETYSTGDVDGDGVEEILLLYTDGSLPTVDRTSAVVLLGADGAIRWTHELSSLATGAELVEVDGETLALVSAGNPYVLSPGALLVLDPDAPSEEGRLLHQEETFYPVTKATALERGGVTSIAYTGIDGYLRTLAWPGGAGGWDHYWGAAAQQTTAFEAGGASYLAIGDQYGTLSLHDAAGARAWSRAMAEGTAYEITALASGQLGGEARIVAAAKAPLEEGRAVIEAYASRGQLRASWVRDAEVLALHVADLDGDDRNELLYVSGMRDDEDLCRLHVMSEAGLPLHEAELGACDTAEIATGDTNGDGMLEIAVRTDPGFLAAPPRLLFLEHDTTLRWFFDESIEITRWMAFAPHGLVAGGGSTSGDGFVALRDFETGEKVWRTTLPDDKEDFGEDASWYGVLFRAGGDYIATHTVRGAVYLLDQGSGEIYWEASSDHPDESPMEDHDGAPLAFVPATEETPAFLAVSQGGVGSARSRFYAVSLTGEVQWEHLMYSPAQATHTIALPDGRPAAAVVTKLGVYTYALGREVEE